MLTKIYEGVDLQEYLGITKYEPPIPVHLAGEVKNLMGKTLKYDIENIQKYPNVLEQGELVVMTEKLHGCVHPDTLIMLPNGEEVPISKVIDDDRITQVLSYDVDTEKFMVKPITGKLRRPNTERKRWVQILLENGRKLRITEDHPVFSNDRNQYIEAKNILPNEDIKSPI